jgi:hypothetical protein
LPTGSCGNSSFDNENNAGFAKLGETLNFSFEHKINNSFSVSAMLYGQRNALNTKAFETQFSNAIFYYDYGSIMLPNWKFKKVHWLSAGFLIGGINEFSLSKKKNNLSINIKAMIGAAYSVSPKLNGSSITDTTTATQTMTSKSAIGLSYLFGAGLKYNILPKHYLLFDVQYSAINELKFKNVTQTFTTAINAGTFNPYFSGNSFTSDATQSITALNMNVGIGMRF